MILTGHEIIKEVLNGKINISPFTEDDVTTNSYDVSLGDTLIRYTDEVIDPKKRPNYELIKIPKDGFLIEKNSFFLGSTFEEIGSNHYVPILHAKSGTARSGLFVHITADLIDIGSVGNLTLQMYSTLPVIVYPRMKIAQVSFWVPKGKIILYDGKYQHSKGPQISKTSMDFK